jgi:anaerobic ribonucleoside-triphosphate reductase
MTTCTDQDLLQENEELRTHCEIWTRVMGYHRPVSQFNKGKQSEHSERQHFEEKRSSDSHHAC